MRTTNQTIALLWVCCLTAGLAGCTQNPRLASNPGAAWPGGQPGVAMAADPNSLQAAQAQLADLERRVRHLDDNNRQLHTQLAQAEQQSQVYKDEVNLMRTQLAEVTGRMQEAHLAAADAQQQFQGLQASSRFRGGATITPNTNLRQAASQLSLGGLPVSFENEAIRIRIPSDQLFQRNSAQIAGNAAAMLDPIAAAIQQNFPRQKIGIEGYTDDQQLYGGMYGSNHQLSAAQASAVFEHLTRRNNLPPQQLFTLAQGSNYPRGDNTTAVGRAANRRVEIVIYPETF
ncbi:OmpA family protein [Rosistilla ulvae]|nr:OmpA family protein [Rosistilla ulvae]